jgi:hypothetical protein
MRLHDRSLCLWSSQAAMGLLAVVVLSLAINMAPAQEAAAIPGDENTACPRPPRLPRVPLQSPRPAQGLKPDQKWRVSREGPEATPTASFLDSLKGNDAVFEVVVGQGRLMTFKDDISGPQGTGVVAVGDPTVLEFEVLPNPRMIRILGKRVGLSDLSIVTADGQTISYEVHVVYDLDLLRAQLRQVVPDASLQLGQIREHVVVEGEARSTEQACRIVKTVENYLASAQVPHKVRGRQKGTPGGRAAVPPNAPLPPSKPGTAGVDRSQDADAEPAPYPGAAGPEPGAAVARRQRGRSDRPGVLSPRPDGRPDRPQPPLHHRRQRRMQRASDEPRTAVRLRPGGILTMSSAGMPPGAEHCIEMYLENNPMRLLTPFGLAAIVVCLAWTAPAQQPARLPGDAVNQARSVVPEAVPTPAARTDSVTMPSAGPALQTQPGACGKCRSSRPRGMFAGFFGSANCPGEPPLGASLYAHMNTQIVNGALARLVLYRYDFCDPGSANPAGLNSHGARRLAELSRIMENIGCYPLVIEPTPGKPELDEARRREVLRQLSTSTFTVPDGWVVVAQPAARGLSGEEAEAIYANQMHDVVSGGTTPLGLQNGTTGVSTGIPQGTAPQP